MQLLFQVLFFVSILFIAGLCVFTAWYVTRRPLQPFARNLLIVLILLELALAVMHLVQFNTPTMPPFLRWFFDLQYEMNLPTIFSSLQLFIVAMVALVNAWATPGLKIWQRLYWLLLVAVFLYFSIDEFYEFHETFGSRVPTEAWRIPYAIGGVILLSISAVAWWRGFRRELPMFVLLFAGIGIMAISGIGIEEFVLRGFVEYDRSLEWMYLFEEMFEMVGATIVLANFLSYAQRHLSAPGWVRSQRFILVSAGLALAWYSLALLVIPGLEARYFATTVDVDYDDGELSLVAYRIASYDVEPGGELEVTFYWRANQQTEEDYSLSVHLLQHGTSESKAQSDDMHAGPIPAQAWFPGRVMRRTVFMQIPHSLPTGISYDVMVRVWYGPWPFNRPWSDTTGLPITRSDHRPLLAHDALLIDRVRAAPEAAPVIQPPQTADYVFPAEGFTLNGYALPQEPTGQHIPVSFWWRTTRTIPNDLTQFLHLQSADGELFAFDQPPFGGTYPTSDWAANSAMLDEWQITLPAEAPAGTYTVYTGLYDPQTVTRSAVTDAGTPLPDSSIVLGEIVYDPSLNISEDVALPDISDYCYAASGLDLRTGTKDNDLFRIHRITGEIELIGRTNIYEAEQLTFSPDGRTLYTIEKTNRGQFGTLDLETGAFSPIGIAISTIPDPATSRAIGTNILDGSDSLSLDPTTGIIWSVHEDDDSERNYLFQINPETGEVVRNVFGPGDDFVEIDLSGIVGENPYVDVEELAIDPRDGRFYIIASNDADFSSVLAWVDFDTLDVDRGKVFPVVVGPITNAADGLPLHDMEGLSFYNDGTLYGVTSNNTGKLETDDSFWEVDPETGSARWIASFRSFAEVSDFEGVACYTGATVP